MTDTYPIAANLDLCNDDDVTAYLDMLYQYVDFEPQHIVALRPQGEKGTVKEGHPGGDVWLQPGLIGMDAFKATVVKYVRGWAQHHQAAFILPAVMNRAAGTAEAVDMFTAVVVDLDKGDTAAALTHATKHMGKPSMVIASGGVTDKGTAKLHVYWTLTEPTQDIPAVMKIRDALAVKLDGDKALGVPATDRTGLGRAHQPIRIPGSVHSKQGISKRVSIQSNDGTEFDLGDLAQRAEDMPVRDGIQIPLSAGKPGGLQFTFSPAAYDFGHKEDIGAALSHDINEGGDGDRNRWTEFSRVAGAYLRQARDGTIDLNTAVDLTRGWMQAKMHPAWPEDRFQSEFKKLHRLDQIEASKVALSEAKSAVPIVASTIGAQAAQSTVATLAMFGGSRWARKPQPPRQFMVQGLLMPRKHHMLVADGGVGKTYLTLELAVKLAAPRDGDTWLGQPINREHCGAVVIFTAEDDTDEILSRFHEMGVMDRVNEATDAGKLYVVPTLEAGGAFPLVAREKDGSPKLSPRWEYWLGQLEQVHGLALVGLDTFNAFNHGEENSATTINELVQALTVICGRIGAAVLVIHHVRKAGEAPIASADDMLNAVRGSGAITASFRAVMGIWHESDYERLLRAVGRPDPKDKTLYRAAVIKGNNRELMREVKYLFRTDAGNLADVTSDMIAASATGAQEARAWIRFIVEHADRAGHPMTRRTHWDRKAMWPIDLRGMPKAAFDGHVDALLQAEVLVEISGGKGLTKALVGAGSEFLQPVPPDPGNGRYKLEFAEKKFDPVSAQII